MDYPEKQGNYLRTMTEPMKDLMAAYLWYRDRGIEKRVDGSCFSFRGFSD